MDGVVKIVFRELEFLFKLSELILLETKGNLSLRV